MFQTPYRARAARLSMQLTPTEGERLSQERCVMVISLLSSEEPGFAVLFLPVYIFNSNSKNALR